MDDDTRDGLLRTLVRLAAHQDQIHTDLRAVLAGQAVWLANQDTHLERLDHAIERIDLTLARLETLISRMMAQDEQGRDA